MDCKTCAQPATKSCHHVNVDGSASVTRYCSKKCQKDDWPTHKAECKQSQYRRQLYGAGRLLQDMFLVLREEAFDQSPDEIRQDADGKLHIYESIPNEERFLFRFSDSIDLSLQDKQALLCHLACDDISLVTELLQRAMRGIYTELYEQSVQVKVSQQRIMVHKTRLNVDGSWTKNAFVCNRVFNHQVIAVTLKDGIKYIIDVAGAQYGQYKAVMPYTAFHSVWVDFVKIPRRPIGGLRETRRQWLERSTVCQLNDDMRAPVVHDRVAEKLEAAVADWEQCEGITMQDLLQKAPYTTKDTIIELLSFVRNELNAFVQQSEADGSFHFERLSGYALATFRLR